MKLSLQVLFLLALLVAIATHVASEIDEYDVAADPFVNSEEETFQQPSRTFSEPAAGDHVILKASAHGDTRTVVDILRHDIDLVHLRNDVGWSALTFAAANGHTELVTALLEHGADPNNQEKDQWTPLMFAAYHGDDGVVFTLIDHRANALLKNDRGFTAHELARLREHDYAAHILGTQSVFQAIATHDMQALLHHVAQGVSPNVQNTAGWTPLISAVDSGDADAVVTLLNLGADANLCERDNWSPLMFAAFKGAEDLVLLLLRHNADPHILAHNREHARSAEEMARERGFNDLAALIASHSAQQLQQQLQQQQQQQEQVQQQHQEQVQYEPVQYEQVQEQQTSQADEEVQEEVAHHMNHHEQQQARHEATHAHTHTQHEELKDSNNKKAQDAKKKKGGTGFFNW